MANKISGLYLIADTSVLEGESLYQATGAAMRGGAAVVQYRDKSNDAGKRTNDAEALFRICKAHGVVFLVNDDPELARQCGADGVHIGRGDASLSRAREMLGDSAIIGVSCYNRLGLATAAQASGADYVAFGSFYPSAIKPEVVRADLGLLQIARREITLPIVAIGGITPDNAAPLIEHGAAAVAAISGVLAAADPEAAAARYLRHFKK